MVGDIVELAPPGWSNLEIKPRESNHGVRACAWKIRYAQLVQKWYPDDIRAEQRERDLRRRAVSLVLQKVKLGSESSQDEGESGQEGSNEMIAQPNEVHLVELLSKVTSIPIRMTCLGDPSIGRTTAILKYLRSYPLDEPFRADIMEYLASGTDRFGNNVYTTNEKGPGQNLPLFHISIIDPPSGNLPAQIASLRGVDSVMIGFAVDKLESIESVASYWVPLVRKWLGSSVPITVVGFKVDLMAAGVSGTTIFEILNSVGIRSFELCLPPYKKSFWSAWTPPNCPLPDGSWP
jgi:GTPase SAR1 family protein